jgi:hypothetical protein
MWKTLARARTPDFMRSVGKRQRCGGGGSLFSVMAAPSFAACSACAGDYEDPERTAGPDDCRDPEYDGDDEATPERDGDAGIGTR